ncbi:DNA alkylation repair protein [Leucobacter manosquensis]|uniref:DNA alkylation repair protein n=1 Tax=Leucobacter manosquensis TaxID=2810611 RepID=A0ABS5M3U0_9MICO|nr:DNA alkylation repair protein [Leucobacter manosquensis]MBS3181485.1 DNA alkylation repair protein [Leucobacter manosquensis]
MSMTDELLGRDRAEALARLLLTANPAADGDALRGAAASLAGRGLSERARLLAGAMREDHGTAPARLNAIVRAAQQDPEFSGWMLWPVGLAVAWSALEAGAPESFDDALALLRELTPRMTSEFAIRPLLRHDLPRALAQMQGWTGDPDWHVRRLASEGSRPLLPWAERIPALIADPLPTRGILDALSDDPEEAVRRSVANHVNDHSRHHPGFVVECVAGWRAAGGAHVDRTSRHALRTLVKRGDADALALLGYGLARLDVTPLALSRPRVMIGDEVQFSATITNRGSDAARIMIDYVLAFPDARGRERTKVFKLARRELAPGEAARVSAAQSFRPISTRRYYPGPASLALQINGVVHRRTEFALGEPARHSNAPLPRPTT